MLRKPVAVVRDGSRRPAAIIFLVALSLLIAAGALASAGSAAVNKRIVGGQATTIAQWPWQVAIVSPGAGSAFNRQFCGGTLVAPRIVLTAAHCVYDENTRSYTPASRLAVVVGRTNLSSNVGQEIPVAKVDLLRNAKGKPLFNPNSLAYDAEVLELSSDATSGTPIKIAGPTEAKVWAAGKTAYVTGWGATLPASGGYPDGLRSAQIHLYSNPQCVGFLGTLFKGSTMLCAGSPPTTDTCDGDSGGPLVVPTAGGDYRLVGSTSWGLNENCGLDPSAYARLAANPLRTLLRNLVLQVSGVDIVGSGALPTTR